MNNERKARLLVVAASAVAITTLASCSKQSEASGGSDVAASLSDVKVGLVPGGPHPYFQPWIQAGEDAKRDFDIGGVEFNEKGEWDQNKQTSELNSMAAQGVSAFGVFGVSATDINTTFTSLKSNDFAVGSLASCPAGDTNEADFCLSTDTEEQAYIETTAAIEAMGGEGNLVLLSGQAIDTNTVRRIDGAKRAIGETDGKVKLLTTITDIETDLQTARKAVNDLLSSRGSEIDGIVATGYNTAVAATAGVEQTGLPIKVIGTDDDATVLEAIRDGVVAGTVVQNPYGQGYVGTWALASLQAGICEVNDPGIVIDSGSFLVTKDNVDSYDQERQDATQDLLEKFRNEYFTCDE